MAQEATRLADLGLSPVDIAKRLGVTRYTVQRWMQAGKLTDTRRGASGRPGVEVERSAEEWGKAVRSSYALDATDDELVRMGEAALSTAHNPHTSITVRLAAMGRFQALVKQLALVARNADAPAAEEPTKPSAPRRVSRPGEDPRRGLMAVK